MNRISTPLEAIADFSNLYEAYRRARRGKRHRGSVERFTERLEHEILDLRAHLLAGSYQPGALRQFEIHDPKLRTISVAPFRDRVVHQALVGALEQHLDRRLDFDSYACRRDKGVDAALRRAVRLSRRGCFVLRSDIRSCFASIPHLPLLELLHRLIRDDRVVGLFEIIIGSASTSDRGLPIGSLTSQWLANLYLGGIDRFARETLKPQGYLRYMDDFCLVGVDRGSVRGFRRSLEEWIPRNLGLELNPRATGIFPSAAWPFLGFRVSPRGTNIRRSTWRRAQVGIRRLVHECRQGWMDEDELARRVLPRLSHLARGCSLGLRRASRLLEEIP